MNIKGHGIIAYDKRELIQLIKEAHLQDTGADLNHVDVSNIEDFSYVFSNMHFSSDISKWNTAKAKNMTAMFRHSKWNGDLSTWNVSHVENMDQMFRGSSFSGNISRWNVSNVTSMAHMFEKSIFMSDISKWNVSRVEDMRNMFDGSVFQGDVSQWDVRAVRSMAEIFIRSDYCGDLSKWRPQALLLGDDALTRNSLREMPQPCFFHWYECMQSMVGKRVLDPAILIFFQQQEPIMTALGLTPMQACIAMQDQWLARLNPAAPVLELPNLDY